MVPVSQYPTMSRSSAGSREVAENLIRSYCGWHITPSVTETLTLDGNGDKRLLLPTKKLTNVLELRIDGVEQNLYSWSEDGWLTLPGSSVFPATDRSVEVVIEHGFGYVPEVTRVVDKLIQRASLSPTGNIVNQRAGTQSVTYSSSRGEVATDLSLLQSEKDALNPYKLNVTG